MFHQLIYWLPRARLAVSVDCTVMDDYIGNMLWIICQYIADQRSCLCWIILLASTQELDKPHLLQANNNYVAYFQTGWLVVDLSTRMLLQQMICAVRTQDLPKSKGVVWEWRPQLMLLSSLTILVCGHVRVGLMETANVAGHRQQQVSSESMENKLVSNA